MVPFINHRGVSSTLLLKQSSMHIKIISILSSSLNFSRFILNKLAIAFVQLSLETPMIVLFASGLPAWYSSTFQSASWTSAPLSLFGFSCLFDCMVSGNLGRKLF